MSQAIEVKVPDIGDYKNIPVIEVLVKAGDTVEKEQSLVTLESDKATMDVPSPASGTVKEVKLKVGDNVSEGTLVLLLDGAAVATPAAPAAAPAAAEKTVASAPAAASAPQAAPAAAGGGVQSVKVPDIGDYKNVPVIEIAVKIGERVEKEQSLVTLESDKATMDVPSPAAGVVKAILVKVGDTVSEGTEIFVIEAEGAAASTAAPAPKHPVEVPSDAPAPAAAQPAPAAPSALAQAPIMPAGDGTRRSSHASPSVRKFSRELGVDVARVAGTGPKGRITQDDITAFVKGVMTGALAAPAGAAAPAGGTGGELNLLPWPKIDFTKFGPVDPKPLSRIKKISGANLHRNWVMIPHVTNNDEADITDLEALRVQLNKENEKAGVKFTMLAFVIKACVAALKKFPTFNASLDGDNLVFKQYYHVGFAADTPNGLVVPVIRDADKKGLVDIAKEMTELSKLAREGKLKPEQMQGGCFSISSLGGIGGTTFTPIINAPEVAILGLSRSQMKPVWDGEMFVPRLTLPLSLSYDHRVIDGAEAARFNAYLASILGDFRRVIL
ncbi:MAG: dihydrolipoyllysine-residue acetyltransferase [Paraburkholderia sp.]|uniref:dihydrolipoyllysine-residue acetyltransferase n=1 Tax=Paraburkholderia sp. TaxID=1926495 RepID=UPI0012082019|nr:dihydrolipoyllysine-residue acetyltransferase [Paraburkholderia sp.]TAM00152.1 MAG: dihydrolipoyllysine-residue acetyltransferase [Paraburkholderia sp.]TAM32585.1 MAG: dihydrolipoyllysine-residue acetyltransferase [Paraburkholderia sp.]